MTIASKLLQISGVKQDIRNALIAKGVDMDSVPFTDYPDKIALLGGFTTITLAEIPGIPKPAQGGIPVTTVDSPQYTGTVTWNPNHDPFQGGTVYTATVELTPKTGYTLMGVPANFFTINGEPCSNAANSGIVAKAFAATATTITLAEIPGINNPVTGETPVWTINSSQYTGIVTWNPNHPTFQGGTGYSATITLTPKTGYTLMGVPANFFKINGAACTNSAGSGVVTKAFAATIQTITLATIPGIPKPVQDGIPVTTVDSPQYTGTVTWNPNHPTFQGGNGYTATITLTPKTGYTLMGVPANFFTVGDWGEGTNEANSGVFTTYPVIIDIPIIPPGFTVAGRIAAGGPTLGLKSDGTCIAAGSNSYGQCNVGDWTDIVQVGSGNAVAFGLKSDGTCVAVGYINYGQAGVNDWIDIIQISSIYIHIVGLKSDGTCVAVGGGHDIYGQLDVGDWTDIIQIAAGGFHTVGLKSDGTCVAVGQGNYGQLNVGDWTDIVQISAGYEYTAGLKSDGTCVVSTHYTINAGDWEDIVQISAGHNHLVGLKSNGTCIAVGANWDGQLNVDGWRDIVQVSAGISETVGLKSDGTCVAVGHNLDGRIDVGNWNLGPL